MRGLLQERKFQAVRAGVSATDMTNVLYFGCKSPDLDFLYKDELMAAVDEGLLSSLKVAFSREQKNKVYVQTLMQEEENAKELYRLIMDCEAHIFVCGGTQMGASVHDAFVNIISTCGGRSLRLLCRVDDMLCGCAGMSTTKATEVLKAKQQNKIYIQELWTV